MASKPPGSVVGEPDMGLPKVKPVFTVDEYLAIERFTEERHEFLDGQIYAMAGESLDHGIASVNLVAILVPQLKGTPCQALTKDSKVRSGPTPRLIRSTSGLYSYPDVVIVCGQPEFHDDFKDVILNPTVVMEVLSPTTETFDRGEKFSRYRIWNPTLKDYLLVSQDEPQIEHHSRNDTGGWSCQGHTGLDAVVSIASIQCSVKLADVYDRIAFASTRE